MPATYLQIQSGDVADRSTGPQIKQEHKAITVQTADSTGYFHNADCEDILRAGKRSGKRSWTYYRSKVGYTT